MTPRLAALVSVVFLAACTGAQVKAPSPRAAATPDTDQSTGVRLSGHATIGYIKDE